MTKLLRDDDSVVYQETVVQDGQVDSYFVPIVTICECQRHPVPFLNEIDYRFDVSVSAGDRGCILDPHDLLKLFQ